MGLQYKIIEVSLFSLFSLFPFLDFLFLFYLFIINRPTNISIQPIFQAQAQAFDAFDYDLTVVYNKYYFQIHEFTTHFGLLYRHRLKLWYSGHCYRQDNL